MDFPEHYWTLSFDILSFQGKILPLSHSTQFKESIVSIGDSQVAQ